MGIWVGKEFSQTRVYLPPDVNRADIVEAIDICRGKTTCPENDEPAVILFVKRLIEGMDHKLKAQREYEKLAQEAEEIGLYKD